LSPGQAVAQALTATTAIASATLTQNQPPVTPFQPVTGSGGTAPLSYSVSPSLPNGLTMSSATGTISGSPTVALAQTSFTVTVTDATSATATASFDLTVNTAVTATQNASVVFLNQNSSANLLPIQGGGGTGALAYAISPTLPTGLGLNGATGRISGTPTVTSPATTYTVTVTDVNGATASNTFQMTVNPAPPTATTAIASATLTQGTSSAPFTPVTGANGTTPLTYTVSPPLPTGLTMDSTTGTISGTPTATLTATSFTVTVTDASSRTASASFTLTVNAHVAATVNVSQAFLTKNFTVNPPFTPIAGSGGTSPLTYSISPALPAGLSLSSTTGAVSGTPTALSTVTPYTVTVTDVNGSTASGTFQLTVNGPIEADVLIPSKGVTVNVAVAAFTPVQGAGGTGAISYAVSPTLPAGLAMNPGTGAISGLPTAITAAATYTVTVTDQNSATATGQFSLAVNGPVSAHTAVPSTTLTMNQAALFTPVTASGGTTPLSFTVTPALPGGLNLNSSTGTISGTPSVTHTSSPFTITVTDANGSSAGASFSLAVDSGVAATTAVASTSLTVNHAATAFTPVTGSGGVSPLAYSVTPALPAGLSFNASNGQITGTPTVSSVATTYTVTVTDRNNATASATFSLVVNGGLTATTAIASTSLTVGHAATSFTPVTASGGTTPLTFAVSPALPAGLSFNTTSGAIAGTPTAIIATTTFTVTVTDTNAVTASATFNLSVVPAPTAAALVSSQNPSSFGQAVTFTATVTGSGATPTGTVTFKDAGAVIGTAALSAGVATFTTTTLSVGSHSITVSYGGSTNFSASTSSVLTQTVSTPVDSLHLHQLQVNVTKVVAQNSGQAISGAIDTAIQDGFSDGSSAFMTPGQGGVRFNFAADDDDDRASRGSNASSAATAYSSDRAAISANGRTGPNGAVAHNNGRIDDAFAAIDQQMPRKAPPRRYREDKDWLFWIDVRGSGIDRVTSTVTAAGLTTTAASLYGAQVNALAGLTYRMRPNFLVGVVGGYEDFSYTEQDINGKLTGNGWTVGSYLGWKITPTLRYDAAVAYSGIGYDGTAGTAQGNFNGNRWLVSTGLTGDYKTWGFTFEPSLSAYALWENEGAYVDSLGTQQASHDFSSGRASAGMKVIYPFAGPNGIQLAPYAGFYSDYYFNQDDATAIVAAGGVPLASTPLLQGWSARATAGVGAKFAGGAMVGVGAEYGGIGSDFETWTVRAKGDLPFSAQ
jgi:hypothetical protein